MKKRIAWLVMSGLMILSLIVTSCAPKVTEEKEAVTEKEVVKEEKEVVKEEEEVVAKREVPQYGGWLNIAERQVFGLGFFGNIGFSSAAAPTELILTNSVLLMPDRLKGPGGTGEYFIMDSLIPPYDVMTGDLAESWEIIQPDTLNFKIRKGVYWQDKPPAYGRELTAEDVVYSLSWGYTRPGSVWLRAYPYLSNMKNPAESVYVDSDDPRTVVVKTAPGFLGKAYEVAGLMVRIVPKGLGDTKGFDTWQGVVSIGPFLLTDYVMGSSVTYKRNPNHWKKDAFHPENQLPYLDGMKQVIIPDLSTQYAALRTGKVDVLASVIAEDAESLMRTNPELLWRERWQDFPGMYMRHDVKPFDDVRVRRAMMMAIDLDEIVEDYYKGKALKFYWPSWPYPEHKDFWIPLEKLPESVQELYSYKPDKTKQLLKEAGYPDGFSTSIVVNAAREDFIDLLSIVKAYWAKVGVDLKIDVKEPGVFATMSRAFTYEHGVIDTTSVTGPSWFHNDRPGSVGNFARHNEPLVTATHDTIHANYFNRAEVARIAREATPDLINLALVVRLPAPVAYNMWQPWLKGYHGEYQPAFLQGLRAISEYVWIDQALKKSMRR